jgi:acetylornithine deacetylase
MSDLAGRIKEQLAARRGDLVELTRDLIRLQSITGDEGAAQAHITGKLAEMGLALDVFEPDLSALETHPAYHRVENLSFKGRPNVVATWKGRGGGRSLILNGHIDTIPVEPIAAWTHAPFSGDVANGKVYGRGASDMKGGLASMTMAVQILRDLGVRLAGDVILQYVVDEELTGYGTLAAVIKGYRADAGICLETSDLCVQPACVGRLWFTLEVSGKAVSVTRHWEGHSAIDKGVSFVQAFKDLEQKRWRELRHPLYPDHRLALPCGVFMFNGGNFPSAVPDHVELRGSLGLMPHEDVDEVKRAVSAAVDEVSSSDPWLRTHPPRLTFKDVGADGAEIPAEHPIVQTVIAAYRSAEGRIPEVSGRVGGADTRYLIKYAKTPTVIFGPGLSSEMHAVDESVPVQNLEVATEVIARSVVDWCGLAT